MKRTLLIGLLSCTTLAHAQQSPPEGNPGETILRVGSPAFRPYPMAVAATKRGTAPEQAAVKALRSSFQISPSFRLLDPKSYLANPKREGLRASSIKFSDWLNVGAEGLIKLGASARGGKLTLDFRFYDVATGQERLQKSYHGGAKEAPRFARAFADQVVQLLTGVPGIFQTRIAAVRTTKKRREIWTMNIDGSEPMPVTKNGSINLLPSWSAKGGSILFTSYLQHNPNLFRASAGGGKAKLLSGRRGLNTGGTMSPNGKKIALTLSKDGNSEIYVMNADGSGLKRLTNEWAIDSSPSWSPDGRQIAFVSSRWGNPQIFVMNADGSNVRRLTNRGTYNQTPDWSPRGDAIAFTARDERNRFDIFTVNPATKEIKRLTQDQGNNEEPSFSPDGNNIVFSSTRGGGSRLFVMGADGSHQRAITSSKYRYTTPSWSPYRSTK